MSHHEVGDRLPWFRSPIVKTGPVTTAYNPVASSVASNEEPKGTKPQLEESPFARNDDHALHDNPQFYRHTEATNAELFYDLFFVANLTVFTQVHEVNDHYTLAQYVGFFCIMWFTWYAVGLYDVRFSMDSIFERVAKAGQFGVMIGFAITGPQFDVGASPGSADEESFSSFQTLTLLLMASRLILVAQYLQSLWFTRAYHLTRVPMLLIAITYGVAALVYLGLYWTFHPNSMGSNNSFIAWYIIAIAETAVVTTVSCVWRVVSFKGTHLVERMSLLTLIILGEGVMGLAEKCQAIGKSNLFTFDPSTIGNIICGILILYFIYMLYFDWIQEEHFGTIRQQIWAFLHFPLHLFLVLAVEGQAQSIMWRAGIVQAMKMLEDGDRWNFTNAAGIITDQWYNATLAQWADLANQINSTANQVMGAAIANAESYTETFALTETLRTIYNATEVVANTSTPIDLSVNAARWVYQTLLVTAIQVAGFQGPDVANTSSSAVDSTDVDFDTNAAFEAILSEAQKAFHVYALTFIYFFVSIGAVVILCTLIAALSKKTKRPVHWIRLAASGFVGLSLALLAVIAVTSGWNSKSQAWDNYTSSAWILPTVTLALFLVIMLNSVRFPGNTAGVRIPKLVPMRSRSFHSS